MSQATPTPPPPSASWQQLFAKRSGAGEQAPGLLYEQSLSNFINAFIDPSNKLAPKNADEVVDDLKAIWEDQGWMPVDELTTTLLRRYRPTARTHEIAAVQKRLHERYNSPEPLAGAQRKQHAPLTISLLHLFAITTNTPVTLIMLDLSNMGNTNAHFHNLTALRDGKSLQDTPQDEARGMTDRAARISVNLVSEAVRESGIRYSQGSSQVLEIRLGGDEFLVAGININREVAEAGLRLGMLRNEEFCAQGGLLLHQYGKLISMLRTGFGIAGATIPLDRNTRPGQDLQKAEKQISQLKQEVGVNRLGRLGQNVLSIAEGESDSAPYALSPAEILAAAHGLNYLPRLHTEMTEAACNDINAALRQHGVIEAATPPLNEADCLNLLQQELPPLILAHAQERHTHFRQLSVQAGTDYEQQHIPPDLPRGVNPYEASDTHDGITPLMAGRLISNFMQVCEQHYSRFLKADSTRAAIQPTPDPALAYKSPHERELVSIRREWNEQGLKIHPVTQKMFEKVLGFFNPTDPATDLLMGDTMPEVFGNFMNDSQPMPGALSHAHAFGFKAAMHNLAGVNALLGSQNANLVLRHFAQHILVGSFVAQGFAREDFIAGHQGGGEMPVAVKPKDATDIGMIRQLEMVSREIEARVKTFQTQNIADFIRTAGGHVPATLDAAMTFGQIPDPRRPEYPGVDATTHFQPLKHRNAAGLALSGGANLYMLDTATELLVEGKRAKRAAGICAQPYLAPPRP